jgi:hypothetical protein
MGERMKNVHLRSPMSKEKFVAELAATAGGQVTVRHQRGIYRRMAYASETAPDE